MTQGQTSYSNDPSVAVPGLIADMSGADVVSCVAGEAIPFGRLVALNVSDGKVYLPKADADELYGLAVFVPTLMGTYPQGGNVIAAGDVVSVMRRGRAFADFDTGTQVLNGRPKVCNDVTAGAQAAKQGKITMGATSADVIRAPIAGAVFLSVRTDTLAMLELDLFARVGFADAITGSLSTVADAPAKAVLTSLIAKLVAAGLIKDGTS